MIFTRDIVNKDIIYRDYRAANVSQNSGVEFESESYNYQDLSRLVDAYKNVFVSWGAKQGNKVVIGTQSRIEQIALLLAAAELGIIITIVDTDIVEDPRGPLIIGVKTEAQHKTTEELITDAYRKLLPIDFFVVKNKSCTAKFDVFQDTCNTTIVLDDEILDYTPNSTILATPYSVFLECAAPDINNNSSVIEHTHDFIATLSQRNSKMYWGKMVMLSNLNHGSSPAVYFLPALLAEKVTDIYNLREVIGIIPKIVFEYFRDHGWNHFMVPYTQYLDEFFIPKVFKVEASLNDCIVYTLGIIRQEWRDKLTDKARDIISIFGSRETSGPTLINQATDPDFTENSFKKLDDFYGIEINSDNLLEIKMPIYNKTVSTKDVFALKNNKYVHQGRHDLLRVNDHKINVTAWQDRINQIMRAELLVDTQKDRIYLAVFERDSLEKVSELNAMLQEQSQGRHSISQYELFTDSELDKDTLMQHFRNTSP